MKYGTFCKKNTGELGSHSNTLSNFRAKTPEQLTDKKEKRCDKTVFKVWYGRTLT
jgi:hypothetical protein